MTSVVHSAEGLPVPTPSDIGLAPTRRLSVSPELAAARKSTVVTNLLRHNLTSPEKRTLKRLLALRSSELVTAEKASRIEQILRADRGLAGALFGPHWTELVARLVAPEHAAQTPATVVGDYLREIGATEHSTVSPQKVKSALREMNELLQAPGGLPTAELPTGPEDLVRLVADFRIEKRDGGLQLVGRVRTAEVTETEILRATKTVLAKRGFGEVDVRVEPLLPPARELRPSR
jgi:hypothetical protein